MRVQLLCVLVLLQFASINTSSAQDPLKVESAHYRLAFENDAVQVVYIHYGPHEKSAMHQHPAGVVVNITDGHLRFTDQNGSTQEVRAIHGEARWFPALRHRVENLSDTAYDGVYISVKGKTAAAAKPGPGAPTTGDAAADKVLMSILRAAQSR
jgi:beta-alanine degradation protein BauB